MIALLLRARLRALVVTVALGLAAPRVARVLRSTGERRRAAGAGRLSWQLPLQAADALDRVGANRGSRSARRRGPFSRRR